MNQIRLLPWVAILALTSILHSATITGKVVAVTDGDTITVLDASKTQHKIRLDGIDAPESGQPFGAKAKQQLSEYVFGKNVDVEFEEKDRYGRIIGDIYLEYTKDGETKKVHVNALMIHVGLAWHYKQYSKDRLLSRHEEYAKSQSSGLWSDPMSIPPWEWRRGVRPKTASKKESKEDTSAVVVYVTNTGTKYHSEGCRYLSKSKIKRTLAQVKGRAAPCSKCNPPK